jgi:GNAT superfamily N-acetyltransferase
VTLTVGPADERDVTGIAELIAEIEHHYGGTDLDPDRHVSRVKELVFGDRPAAYVLLARDGDRLVGLATYSFLWPAAGSTRSLFLKELYVRSGDRRRGVGRLLMAQVFEIAGASGCSRVEWTTEPDNEEARRFYQGLGVAPHPDKMFYRADDKVFTIARQQLREGGPGAP